jgi:2-polyprenyl-3-methyl-5-hydroxy-6-metoxy-1,4-benzoquinol methylase
MRGWLKTEKTTEINSISESWLRGYFADSHYDWDGKTWNRNFTELRTRDLALTALGDVSLKKILDVGCGDGTYSYVLAKLGAITSGQDWNVTKIQAANERIYGNSNELKGEFICADAKHLKFDSNSFDAVFSADFFEHIDLITKRQVIAEIYRVLKPGGILVIKTPNLDYLKLSINLKRVFSLLRGKSPLIYIAHTNNNPDNEHHGLTNYDEMREELEAAFFHTPIFIFQQLIRKGIPPTISNLMFKSQIKSLNEHLIISTKKSIFVGVSDGL